MMGVKAKGLIRAVDVVIDSLGDAHRIDAIFCEKQRDGLCVVAAEGDGHGELERAGQAVLQRSCRMSGFILEIKVDLPFGWQLEPDQVGVGRTSKSASIRAIAVASHTRGRGLNPAHPRKNPRLPGLSERPTKPGATPTAVSPGAWPGPGTAAGSPQEDREDG